MLFTIIRIAITVAILPLLFLTLNYLVKWIQRSDAIHEQTERLLQRARKNESERRKEELSRYEIEGVIEKQNFMSRLDMTVNQAGVKQVFPWITTEIYIIGSIVIAGLLGLLGSLFFGMLGFACGLIGGILFFVFTIVIMKNINYDRVEKEIVTFINLVENYSKTSDDIIDIIGKTCQYVESPLKDALESCYADAHNTGNVEIALQNLQSRIEHEKFKEIISNIEIASRHEADYASVIEDERLSLQDYMNTRREIKSMKRTARFEILLIAGLGAVMLWVTQNSMGMDISYVFDYHTLLGLCIDGAIAAVTVLSIWLLYKRD